MLSRRAFLAGSSALTIAGTHIEVRAQGGGVRRSARTMSASDPDLAAYSRAVAAMKALPASDPRNWNRFAAIHANFCPHGNWFFLPWHRAYLVSLERICRDLSGKADFALPYWDWSLDRQLPAAFTTGTPQTNPLNHRRPGSLTITDDMTGPGVISRIMQSPDFEAFGSSRPRGQTDTNARWQRRMGAKTELEFNPHDGIHQTVGGDMGQVANASRDPIFYLHHANVDRLWSAWNARGNQNSGEAMWRNFAFNRNFPQWDVAVSDLLSTGQLGYRYDNERGPFAADVPVEAVAAAAVRSRSMAGHLESYRRFDTDTLPRGARGAQRIALAGGGAWHIACAESSDTATRDRPVSIPVPFGRPIGDYVKADALASSRLYTNGSDDRQCVWAMLRDIEPPKDPKTRVRIYLNREGLLPNTSIGDPHYVTSLSFFGTEHMQHAMDSSSPMNHHAQHNMSSMSSSTPVAGGCATVDLTAALARLSGTRYFRNDRLVVQLMPVCPGGDSAGTAVRARRVEIAVI